MIAKRSHLSLRYQPLAKEEAITEAIRQSQDKEYLFENKKLHLCERANESNIERRGFEVMPSDVRELTKQMNEMKMPGACVDSCDKL